MLPVINSFNFHLSAKDLLTHWNNYTSWYLAVLIQNHWCIITTFKTATMESNLPVYNFIATTPKYRTQLFKANWSGIDTPESYLVIICLFPQKYFQATTNERSQLTIVTLRSICLFLFLVNTSQSQGPE